MTVSVLTGDNAFGLQQALSARVGAYQKDHGDFAVEKLQAGTMAYDSIVAAIQTVPFLVDKKLVVLNDLLTNKDLCENIETVVALVPDSVELIIVEPLFDKRSKVYKTLKKLTDFHEFAQLDEQRLARWAVEEAKSAEGILKIEDASYLVQRIGIDQLRLKKEIDKLVLYDPHITRQSIDNLTEPIAQHTVFNLLDAAFSQKVDRALNLYQSLKSQKVEPQALLAMIAWQLHVLAVVKAGSDRSQDEIAANAKVSPFVVRKSVPLAHKRTLSQVKNLVALTLAVDEQLKRSAVDADDALQHLLIEIARQKS